MASKIIIKHPTNSMKATNNWPSKSHFLLWHILITGLGWDGVAEGEGAGGRMGCRMLEWGEWDWTESGEDIGLGVDVGVEKRMGWR